MSAILELIAGTLMVLFTRFFLQKIAKHPTQGQRTVSSRGRC
jgi:hypothetical protein